MPNWCYGSVLVKGTKENKRKFLDLFLTESKEENAKKTRYFARSWLNDSKETIEKELEDSVTAFGIYVAWSVYSCMINGYPQENDECPTVFEISKELELEIQIASEEQGCCFREFYHIKNGKLISQECEDFPESEFDSDELYEKYLIEWKETHNEGNPASFDEWMDCEYQEIRDRWYWEVYDKLTLA